MFVKPQKECEEFREPATFAKMAAGRCKCDVGKSEAYSHQRISVRVAVQTDKTASQRPLVANTYKQIQEYVFFFHFNFLLQTKVTVFGGVFSPHLHTGGTQKPLKTFDKRVTWSS